MNHARTARQLLGLIDRDQSAARVKLTPLGRDVLATLLKAPVDEQDASRSAPRPVEPRIGVPLMDWPVLIGIVVLLIGLLMILWARRRP